MINIKEDKNLSVLNHSCAHLMAQAVKHLYPNAKFWVGPVVEEGFYYDMDLGDIVLTDEDIEKISKEMKKIAKDGKKIIRHEISKQEALEMFKDDPYKIDLIENMPEDEVITCYSQGDFTDLCRGPHVDNVKMLKNFKLLKFSGAYYKGDSKNKVLQRIYGVCFDTPEALEQHLAELEDAKARDHRKLGKDLGIFMFSDLVGKGLPMWLPNGFIVRRALVDYIMDKEISLGYQHVMTPSLGNVELYKTSGHWDHYKDDMFPKMELDDEAYVLRPMNCPHHMMMFKNRLHSYRDLPIRIAGILSIQFGNTCEMLYAGMDERFKKFMPQYKEYVENFKWAFERGCLWSNMGGVEGTLDDGLTKFKDNFNPTINEMIGEFDIPVHPIMYRLTQKAYEILKSKHM